MSFLYSNPLFVCDMLIHASWIDGVPWSSQSDVITSWRHHWLTSGSSISSRHSHMSTTFANYPCPIIHLPHTSFLLRLHYWTIPPILFIIDPDLWFNIGCYFLHTTLLWFHYIILLLRCIQSFTDMIRLCMQLFDHTSVLLHVYYLLLMECYTYHEMLHFIAWMLEIMIHLIYMWQTFTQWMLIIDMLSILLMLYLHC